MKNKLQVKFLLFFGALLIIASGFSLNPNTVYGAMSGTLTSVDPTSSGSCSIPENHSGCNVYFSWNTTNPVGTSSVSTLGGGTTIATGNSGVSVPMPVFRHGGSVTYALYNNAVLLDQKTVTATCAPGTTWNNNQAGPFCQGSMSGTLTPSATSCVLASGEDTCPISFSWTTSNLVGPLFMGGNCVSEYGPVASSGSGTIDAFLSGPSVCMLYVSVPDGQIIALDEFTVQATSFPDLTASTPTPTNATINTPQTFSSTITNIGTSTTGGSFVNLFQTSTSPSGSNPTDYAVTPSMSQLSSTSGSNTAVTQKSITFNTLGVHYVRACADKPSAASVDGAIDESNENNNCSAWTAVNVAGGPVPYINISASPTSGIVNVVSPNISWTVSNDPTSCEATGDWTVPGPKPTDSLSLPGKHESQGVLTQIKTYIYTLTCTNVYGTSDPASATVVVSATVAPNLTASSPNPTSAATGIAQIFTASVSNTGTASTGVSFSNYFQTSTDGGATWTDLTPSTMGPLDANTSAVATSPSVTFSPAGTYSVRFCADLPPQPSGVVSESNENDNCSAWTAVNVTDDAVVGPDLTASVVSPVTATTGVAQTYTSTISNIGNASTPKNTSFTNLFQTSLDAVTVLNEYTVSGMSNLSAGGSANTQKSISFSSAGTYFIRVCADKSSASDPDGVIDETNEDNNCSGSWNAVLVSNPVSTMSGTLTPASSFCSIPQGQSSCNINFSWRVTNPEVVGGSAVTKPVNITVGTGDNRTNVPLAVKYGGDTFYLYNNNIPLATSNVFSSCVAGTEFISGVCTPSIVTNAACATPPVGGYSSMPTEPLCSAGTSTTVTEGNGFWTWNCLSNNNGISVACVAYSSQSDDCPAGSVTLSPTSIAVGGTAQASAPAATSEGSFSGGTFGSRNSSIATVDPATGLVTTVSSGVARIFGNADWTYTFANGDEVANCSLQGEGSVPIGGGGTSLTVKKQPRFIEN